MPPARCGRTLAPRRNSRRKSVTAIGSVALLLITLLAMLSCAGVSNGGGGGGNPTPPGTYAITITGSSSGAPQDSGQRTQVSLVVN